jgi:hypothetical protein
MRFGQQFRQPGVHRIADQAQVLVGTARKQVDSDQWHGPVSLPPR